MRPSTSFTAMTEGTPEQYETILRLTREQQEAELADNVLNLLRAMRGPKLGYAIDRYEHSLQSATRALRDKADEETIVCALLHDIGDTIAPDNHSQVAAAILRPYVSDKNHWIILHHGLFQGYYYYDKIGKDPEVRERHRGHPHFDDCVRFCERWDQCAFDPDYPSLPLEHFEPMVRRIFAREPFYFD
jgi:predicted HD phosphohydrolase